MAELEYGSRGKEISNNVKQYVSEFDDLDGLRQELDRRDSIEETATMEDIYAGGGLNCSVRTIAQVAYEEVNGLAKGSLHVQYEPISIMGIELPGKIPTNNHIVYEGADDTVVYDWNYSEAKNEEFDVEDIVGLRSLNLIIDDRYKDFESVEEEFHELRNKREDSEFLEGMANGIQLDTLAEELPEPARAAYDSITGKLT